MHSLIRNIQGVLGDQVLAKLNCEAKNVRKDKDLEGLCEWCSMNVALSEFSYFAGVV